MSFWNLPTAHMMSRVHWILLMTLQGEGHHVLAEYHQEVVGVLHVVDAAHLYKMKLAGAKLWVLLTHPTSWMDG